MSNVLKPKRSWTANAVPTTSDLVANEVAFNFADNKLFVRNPTTGNIVSVSLGGGGSGLTWSSVPASATATGTAGQIAYDSQYQYICVATNTWARISLAAFTPARISGLQLWLDASDPWTLFDATSGGSAVAANGIVKRWEDKSGYARHATESTNGPTRKTAVQNGFGTLDFDGTNDTLQIANSQSTFAFLHQATQATVFTVYRPTYSSLTGGDTEYYPIWETGSYSALGAGVDMMFNNAFGNSQMMDWRVAGVGSAGRTRRRISGGAPNNSFSLQSIVTDNANATPANRALLYRNGASNAGTTVTGSGFDNGTVSTGNASRNFTISGSGTATGASTAQFFNGDIAEIIIYNAALTDADRASVESYLIQKWAIS
jgi:hypothetical protein